MWDNAQIGGAQIISDAGWVTSSWHIAGTGDFDGNGRDDILWRNDNGMASIWNNAQIGSTHHRHCRRHAGRLTRHFVRRTQRIHLL
jgi:FG-GAP repeat protein